MFVTIDPEDTKPNPPYRLRIRTALHALQQRIGAHDKRRRRQLASRLEQLEPELDQLLDPREYGLGRAFFAAVDPSAGVLSNGDGSHLIELQTPLIDLVMLEPTPYVRPLLEAAQFGAPAGLLAISREGIRQIDFRYGMATELEALPITVDSEDWRELTAPARPRPQFSVHAVSARDHFEQRIEEHVLRAARDLVPAITATAEKSGWETVLVTGEPRLLAGLTEALPANGRTVIRSTQIIDAKHSATDFACAVEAELRAARIDRAADLRSRARDAALSGGPGTLGLLDTLAALQAGQVDHLLLAADREWTGDRAEDGTLLPADPVSAGEPHLGERMIELAIRYDADVTMVPPEVSEDPEPGVGPGAEASGARSSSGPGEDDGVAALLRWR